MTMELNGQTTVKEMLETHPEVFPVMLAHGMCEDCKQAPPPVPLSHFAQKHCEGRIEALIEELKSAMQPAGSA